MNHQKAKHYKCSACNRRLNTAGGLAVHLQQVHKEELHQVDNALPSREEPNVEIFGMEGIPDDVKQQHDDRITQKFFRDQEVRAQATGNAVGGGSANPKKRPPMASIEEMRQQLEDLISKNQASGAAHLASDPARTFPASNGEGLPFDNTIHPSGANPGSFATPQANGAASLAAAPPTPTDAVASEKKGKKSKDKARLKYSDDQQIEEEKLLAISKYRFDDSVKHLPAVVETVASADTQPTADANNDVEMT